MKPFLTDRIKSTDQNISLFHDNRVINDPVKVCNIFNDYFINAAWDIGKEHPIQHDENIEDILCSHTDHIRNQESGILYLQHNRTNEKVTTYINKT